MSDIPKGESMISVGIDIGTSTTKLVISRFLLKNTAGVSRVPSIHIIDREIIYKSAIFRTPLLSRTEIDMDAIEQIILDQYRAAGISPRAVQTGAAIITGEAATKANAEEVLYHLSSRSGDFLVAAAGPDLEAIIAAKGSGLYDASRQSDKVFANIDIGGGTANIAVCQYGKLIGTCTLHIGGKLIEFENRKISYVSHQVRKSFDLIGIDITEGSPVEDESLKAFSVHLAAVLARALHNQLRAEDQPFLLGHQPNWDKKIDVITFSGGVAECMYRYENDIQDTTSYDDIGLRLAESIFENPHLAEFEWRKPDATVRATVIGAGTQTTEISGATIQVEPSLLPIRNLPVHRIEFRNHFTNTLAVIGQEIKKGTNLYDPFHEGQNFALYLANIPLLGFREIHQLAEVLIEGNRYKKNPSQVLVLVLERDMARALGQSLQVKDPKQMCICIDQIKVEHGDYLDIGKQLQSGVVPVVTKTLAFH
ncbi:ethanolamine ammonia-lyase reactivating factor EutA [Bacillus sp. V5-8f]|uniref:ethanolamine ammonia-lyase reactivating factor EutA n=1 Tax=Bacillus sp. V5-8f TaxID=2053044 RepID=UPI000C7609D6|nr:ethanolamine ammonia-lyase reactivating factor EutA [Bacillus sp. V5-8f]PLT32695.1 ethanolamine utilization protein [Bacillus sp. V5-8f]